MAGKIRKAGSKPETSAAIFHPGVTASLHPIAAAIPAHRAAWCQAWFEAVPKEGTLLRPKGLAQHHLRSWSVTTHLQQPAANIYQPPRSRSDG